MKLSGRMINTAALGISSGLNFLSLIIWTYLLSPAEFGVYSLLTGTVLFLYATLFEWMRLTSLRLLYDPNDAHDISPAIANAAAVICLSVAVAALPFAVSLSYLDVSVFGVGAQWWLGIWAWVVSEMVFTTSTMVARLRVQSWRFFALMSVRSILSLALGVALVWMFDMGAVGIAAGVIVSQVGCALVSGAFDPAWRRLRPFAAKYPDVRTVLIYGAPLIISASLNNAGSIVDRYIVSFSLGSAAVGQYAVSVDLMQKTVIFLMLAVNLTAYPAIIRAVEKGGQEAGERELADNFIIYLLIGLPAVAAFAALSPGVARLLVGPEYRAAVATLLPYIGIAAIFKALSTFHLSVALQMVKKSKLLIISPVVNLCLMVPSGLIGVHMAGVTGMACGIALSQFGSFLLCYFVTKRHVHMPLVTRASVSVCALSAVVGLSLLPFRGYSDPIATIGLFTVVGLAFGLVTWRSYKWLMRNNRGPLI